MTLLHSRNSSPYLQVGVEHLDLALGGKAVLRDLRWRIKPGERWVLAGGNGAGKTQLLKILAGSVWPTPTGRERRWYRYRGELRTQPEGIQELIAYLGPERQDRYERYDWNFTVEAVVGTGLYRTDMPLNRLTRTDRARIAALLRRLQILQLRRRRFLTLSYGERRLVLLARALASRPALLLLDEVTNGLDGVHRERLLKFMASTSRGALPWVWTTHRAEEVPASATHLAALREGELVYRGRLTPRALRAAFGAGQSRGIKARVRAAAPGDRPFLKLKRAYIYAEAKPLLRNVSMSVHHGECWVIHGGNGAGKSTLLRALYGDHPVARGGTLWREGIEPGVPLSEFRARVGLIAPQLQTDHPQYLGVLDTVVSGLHASVGLNEQASPAERRRARGALEAFGLLAFAGRELRALSYGQLRRVLFARAWVGRPELLLLDEPYAGIDTATRIELQARVEDFIGRGGTVILATHHRAEWPQATTHELQLAHGRVVYCGRRRA